MNRILKLIAIVLVLTILPLPVLCDMNGGKSDGGMMDGGRTDANKINNGSMHEKAKEMYDNGSKIRDAEGMMGMGFMHREDNSYGNYVTFSVDNNTGNVLNFGISGIAVFDSIKIPGFDFKETSTMGAETRIVNKDGSIVIQLHDNPAAVINIMADVKTTLIFNLASGANATKQDNIVKIMSGNVTAYIASEKATSIIAGSQVTIETDSGSTVFRASPVNMPYDNMEERFMGEMMTKKAGAEVSVGDSDKYSIVNYSEDMNVMIQSMEKNHMRMMINSSNHSGKFIMMNIDNSSMTWNERQKVRFYLDNKPMRQVMSEQELYDANESSFWLNMVGRNRMQAVMYIANFSERQVDIVVEDEGTPTPAVTPEVTKTTIPATPGAPGFEVIIGLLGTAVAYRLRRKL
jgi:hypothetical protein